MSIRTRVLSALAIAISFFLGAQGAANAQQFNPTDESVYAYVSEEPTPEGVLDLCRERLVTRPYDECRIFVLIEDARERGVLEPGAYTKAELEAILGTSLDQATSSRKAKRAKKRAAKHRNAAKNQKGHMKRNHR